MLTKQEVQEWKHNAVTKRYFEGLKESRDDILEFIAAGGVKGKTTDETAQELAGELGKIKAIDDILNYMVEDMIDEAVSFEEETEE